MATQTEPTKIEQRAASAFQLLHWLAAGRIDSTSLTATCLEAIAQDNPRLNAFVTLDPGALEAARQSDARHGNGPAVGRLDGLPVAIKDNLDVAGLPTGAGLPGRGTRIASSDAAVVARLRAAGAVILGKTQLDEGALGTMTANPHSGPTQNPFRAGFTAGGSSGGSAAAVAAGLCAFALGSDTLGSVRIPASHCGVIGMRPTPGEISTRGMVRGARRLDSIGVLARSVPDIAMVLQTLAGFDEEDPRSRRRRVPLAIPDWQPTQLRSGFVPDLAAIGVVPEVCAAFQNAIDLLGPRLGQSSEVDFSAYDFARMRRAALLVMESELAIECAADLADAAHPVSARLRGMLEFAYGKSAVDYAAADRMLDRAVVFSRHVFTDIDVLVLPTMPHGPYRLDAAERANDADLTAFASLAGCPAISLPMGTLADGLPIGLQLVGRPGSDLRLLELAEICASTLDAAPAYPVGVRG